MLNSALRRSVPILVKRGRGQLMPPSYHPVPLLRLGRELIPMTRTTRQISLTTPKLNETEERERTGSKFYFVQDDEFIQEEAINELVDRIEAEHTSFNVSKNHRRCLKELITLTGRRFWTQIIFERPELLQLNAEQLFRVLDGLKTLEVGKEFKVAVMTSVDLDLLKRPELLVDRIRHFKALADKYKFHGRHVVINHPDVLLIDVTDIQYQIEGILETLQKKDIGRLVDNVPGVLTEAWEDLEAKIKYLTFDMHVASSQICDCEILAYDLDFIRQRHLFLDRCGIYKNPHPKSVGLHETAEPPIDRLVGSDKYFMTLLSGRVSMAEWNTFRVLYEEEKAIDFDTNTVGGDEDVAMTFSEDVDEEEEDDEETPRSTYAKQEERLRKEAKQKRKKRK